MKLYFHYCPAGFSNSYILGTTSINKDALIIDPGNMDSELLNIIEENEYALKGVLITHDHSHHVRGLDTLMKIYNTEVYAINPLVRGHRTILVRDGETVNIGPFEIEIISVPGHSADSAVYKTGRLLFTGDVLSAGRTGNTASSYAAATQFAALHSKILSLPGDYTVLPGHGPPSSLEAERRFNLDLNSFDQQKKRRSVFTL